MSIALLGGSAMVAAALPLAWVSISGRRTSVDRGTLQRGFGPVDLRGQLLDLSARDRAIAPAIAALADRARRMTPAGMVERLESRIAAAGKQGIWTIEQLLAIKLMLGIVGVLFGGLRLIASPSPLNLVFAVVVTAIGWFATDIIVDGRGAERRKAVQRELPDMMDQITIAVEAGLGFEAALARVAAGGHGVLSSEIARTLQDIQLGVPRSEALAALSARCDIPDLRHFVSATRQAEKYGLPIAGVLRVQSAELREKRKQRAEEQAMKIPVKVLFPLVFCILPTMFIVIIGPGAIQIARSFMGS